METTIEVNGKAVKITLTADQLQAIKKATAHFTDIKTFEYACAFEGIDPVEWLEERKSLATDERAYGKLRIIVKAINGGIAMDYKDTSVYKRYPWFNAVGSGAGFSFNADDYGRSYSGVGSRLCFTTADRVKYAATQFIEIYNEYINAN